MLLFAERIKKQRISKSLTQKSAAEIFGVGLRHWQKYEAGEVYPTVDGLIALADYFDVSIDYLVGRSEDPARR